MKTLDVGVTFIGGTWVEYATNVSEAEWLDIETGRNTDGGKGDAACADLVDGKRDTRKPSV